jgi:DNA-binding transcriptional LysR family regulator
LPESKSDIFCAQVNSRLLKSMNSEISWDEFRLVKSVADARSLVGAAEALGLNHSTVFRRLGAIEATIGARLFERSRSGYQPTAAGEEMVELATRMSESIVDFERRVAGRDVKPSGDLRVTTVDTFATGLLPPVFTQFRQMYPDVRLELLLSTSQLNLSRRDADVAIRATNDPPDTLVGRRIAAIRWGVYTSGEMRARYGSRLVENAPWVGFSDGFGPATSRHWLEKNIGDKRQVFRANSVQSLAQFIAMGGAAGILPCFVADTYPQLQRYSPPLLELDVSLWILTHADLRHSAKVRAFMDFTGNELAKLRRRIEGE